MQLTYVMKFVADMDQAVHFYRDLLGLPLKFQSPGWSEFTTGDTTLALHAAAPDHPAGAVRLGFRVADLPACYADLTARGVTFTQPPTAQFGISVAEFLDLDGGVCSVSGEQPPAPPG